MAEIIAALLALGGGVFALIAAVGILRLPDVLTRMHASTKAGTLGSSLILAAVAVQADATGVTIKVVAAIFFLLLTAPLAAHMIGRAAERTGVPLRLFERMRIDAGPRPEETPARTQGDP